MREMEKHLTKTEIVLRISVTIILSLSASLIVFDSQTIVIAFAPMKVTFRVLRSLEIGMYIIAVAAAYNLLQLVALWFTFKQQKLSKSIYMAWFCYLLDQTAAYVVFAGTSAAAENSLMVVKGSKEVQWMKWCNKFTRFCFQAGGAVVCSYVAAAVMVVLSFLSAFHLFRFYSPKHFLLLKSTS